MKKDMQFILALSVILFLASLIFKTYCINGECRGRGFLNFLIGWLGVFHLNGSKAWLANPFLIISWFFFFQKPKTALILSVIAFLFAVSFYFQQTIVYNEAGMAGKITGYKAGYWLWVSSICVMILGSLRGIFKGV